MTNEIAIHNAIIFATVKHQNQKRKGTDIPYIVHPMEVMQILIACRAAPHVIIAGILHDTLEDTDTTPNEIADLFGLEVLRLVQTESEDKSKTWKERKKHTIDCLKTDSVETMQVCCADKLSNIRSMNVDFDSIGEKLWERFNASKTDITWYYESILHELKTPRFYEVQNNAVMVDEFEKIVSNLF